MLGLSYVFIYQGHTMVKNFKQKFTAVFVQLKLLFCITLISKNPFSTGVNIRSLDSFSN